MKIVLAITIYLGFGLSLHAQEKINKTRFIIGLSTPELFHAGVTHRLANISEVGLNVGAGPSSGTI